MDDQLANFVGITGATEDAAHQVLDMCGGDLERAIQLWFSDEELQRNLTNPASSSRAAETQYQASSSQAGPAARTSRSAGREDASGVIHIDSDDDDADDVQEVHGSSYAMDIDDDDDDVVTVARTAQEEEDAAMAQRLQQELYQGQAAAAEDDGVRAPMARTTETLVAPSGNWTIDDDMGGVRAAVEDQLRRRQQQQQPGEFISPMYGSLRFGGALTDLAPTGRPSNNPFAQSIWEDSSSASRPAPGSSSNATGEAGPTSRAQRLAELFRPPYTLMSHLPWDDARDEGKQEKKWILVNLQDMTDFNCQALNRDIWKDEAIQQLIKENFIFLQYSKDDPRADQYVTFYLPNGAHENQSNYPHVSIVDPRTGEQVKVWTGIPFPSALDFHAELAEFLDRYSLEANSKNPVVKAKRPERTVVDVDRMTEEEMLQMAMQNSLDANDSAKPSVYDPDELTKSNDKGKGKAETEPADAGPSTSAPAQASVFSIIPADRPHVEPANDPATTTRIQFRHPTGRVIRRFALDDRVARIYEWLKAEPLEGKDGVEFELKVMPDGRDLIQDVDKTIAEAGLKQGTVMIEFIED